MNDFEEELTSYLLERKGKYPRALYEAMEYALLGGGKRIRPKLCFLSAKFCKVPKEKVMHIAMAIECIHSYSLIHDDMPCMDNDTLRRGKPTVHAKFGEAMALLAGDALLNLAYEILFDRAKKDPDIIDAAAIIAKLAGAEGMVGGQAMEFSDIPFDKDTIFILDEKKTGGLIECAALAPAMLSGDFKKVSVMHTYGRYAGLAFQFADDIIDMDKQEKTSILSVADKEYVEEKLKKMYVSVQRILSPWGNEGSDLLDFFALLSFRFK